MPNVGTLHETAVNTRQRGIAFRTTGRRHGPITRLVSPSGVGERIKASRSSASTRTPASRR